ncbi:MAG: glycerol-3-phosphate dehydrogenase/oxidase [Chloroflexota bacterium]
MFESDHRQKLWSSLDRERDLLIIGGGITGVGILRESARVGLDALLVEQRDFAWGTSSRSSKLVHGGLRYLQHLQVGLTRASVRERERLLGEAPGLIDPLGWLLANYEGDSPGRWMFSAGLSVYDLLALHWSHRHYDALDFQQIAPHISSQGLQGGFRYGDAQTDDARLVLRLLQEALDDGGEAINYTRVDSLLRDEAGHVVGATLTDQVNGESQSVTARLVINATGAWADKTREPLGLAAELRPLRGSHLIFPGNRLPVAQAISFLHPIDRRPVFVFPWEGISLVGTTDVDHRIDLDQEPCISPEEVSYLMAAVQYRFPSLELELTDILSTFAGVRPVIDTGKAKPSDESRDHVIWQDSGMITVTGGKLTTFRLIAHETLKHARKVMPDLPQIEPKQPVLDASDPTEFQQFELEQNVRQRLVGRYGTHATDVITSDDPSLFDPIPGTNTLWVELVHAARREGVVHLDDLLLRRVRIGLLLPHGGIALLPYIRELVQSELGWSDEKWMEEEETYLDLWARCYASPEPENVPDWHDDLQEAMRMRRMRRRDRARMKSRIVAAGLTAIALVLTVFFFLNRDKPNENH